MPADRETPDPVTAGSTGPVPVVEPHLVRRLARPEWPEGREIVLVGTAHISPDSLELVRETIAAELPDAVALELDEGRFEALMDPEAIAGLDLKQVVRERKLLPLLAGLALGAWQAKMGLRLGVEPGAEMREAALAAREHGADVCLVDRPVRTTLLRVWRRTGFWSRMKLLAGGAEGGAGDEPTAEDLRELLSGDVVSRLVAELGEEFPVLKEVVIDERDAWIAEEVRAIPGRVVVVIGAGHLDGVERWLLSDAPADVAPLARIPPPGWVGKAVGIAIPVVILGALAWTFVTRGPEAAADGAMFWVLVNSIPAAIGAAVALAHPLTILAALVSAPFTSLTPVLGAGYVTAFVQAWVRPPRVFELTALKQDALVVRRWFGNRALRIALALLFPTIGSAIGTFVGGSRLLSGAFG